MSRILEYFWGRLHPRKPLPPPPSPMPPPAGDIRMQLLAAFNQMRADAGVKGAIHHQALEDAAQAGATAEAAGGVPHADLEGRLRAAGWPVSSKCRMSRSTMPVNYSEGVEVQHGPIGVDSLKGLASAKDDHRRDFFDPHVTHVGFGTAHGDAGFYGNQGYYLVVCYGVMC
jgi:hypothetical protein